ncbi:hypothetical protein DZC31_11065 [Stenotrophomonas rhizophila]|nr:hypothetical protein DZC31_11065 [Stenotrophomonas rhizophila]
MPANVAAASATNTGAAGVMHRVGFFAAKAAPTGYADRLRTQFSFESAATWLGDDPQGQWRLQK